MILTFHQFKRLICSNNIKLTLVTFLCWLVCLLCITLFITRSNGFPYFLFFSFYIFFTILEWFLS